MMRKCYSGKSELCFSSCLEKKAIHIVSNLTFKIDLQILPQKCNFSQTEPFFGRERPSSQMAFIGEWT